MTRFIIVIAFLLCACNYNSNHAKTGEGRPSPGELKYAIGDCLSFKVSDSTYGSVVVCDFSKDAGGIWYGVFYSGYESTEIPTIQSIKEGKVMGRKVESSIDEKGYEACLDGDFISDSVFTDPGYFTLIGNLELKRDIHLGSHGAVTSMPMRKYFSSFFFYKI